MFCLQPLIMCVQSAAGVCLYMWTLVSWLHTWVWWLWLICAFSALYNMDVIFLLLCDQIKLQWAILIHCIPFYFLSVHPRPAAPRCVLATFSCLFLQLIPVSTLGPHHLHHLTPFIPHCPPHFPSRSSLPSSVFCVSRTLMVTQIFWLSAVPWGWDAVSALH